MKNHQDNQICQQLHVGFMGAGSIVEAILKGITAKYLLPANHINVTNHSDDARLSELQEQYGVTPNRDLPTMLAQSDVLFLAMKPKDVATACQTLRDYVTQDHLVISVIAGVPTSSIQEWLGVDCPIIRAMPNTSSAVGLSATGMAAGRYASEHHMAIAECLFQSIGHVCTVPEHELDIITGLSGSGPAYIYYLVEAMEGAGQRAGLTQEMSRELTVQTLLGAAHMLMATKEEPAVLRKRVTSPGGTTQAGLEVLEARGFKQAVTEAVLRATERARELGAPFR
ncbi:Pyrroline-5-carboxylate reductase [Brevibacillus laterosporus]|uniref:Pyrroline-5-carboxylate reductase n=1 Tax=Brevibacillus laterosporus TaxID=1465 RepID=A0A518V319_BRELA|nr:pyrroline-5-carboxylate reductase [Brevibacillus laterosporus]QDX91396.1 pyrroline-5-carboxylate reductase [Brevibacillus laterosporus]RAP28340.1 Pyrroline-5-carboxylate reductase [Brevibacillus laterosporus]